MKKKYIVDALGDKSYMFNAAPAYKEAATTQTKMRKRKERERKKLEKRAEMAEFLSSDDEGQRQVHEDGEDYGLLEQIDQDILGYFQMRGPKIISSTVKVPNQTYDMDSLHLGAVCDIGPNGAYLIVNFSRNKKGFVDLRQLRTRKNVSAGDYQLGEYVLTQVIDEPRNNKVQLTMLPSLINQNLKLKDITEGMSLSCVAVSHNEFGYTLNFGGDQFTGFINAENLKLGRVYIVKVNEINLKERVLKCQIGGSEVGTFKPKLTSPKWLFTPGTSWPCTVVKELTGGALVKINKIGVLGYVFQDYIQPEQKKITCRIIAFDEKSRNIYMSAKTEHVENAQFKPEFKVGNIYDGVQLVEKLYSGSMLVNVLTQAEGTVDVSKKVKKNRKAQEKAQDFITGPTCFLHGTHVPEDEFEDVLMKACMIKEINYFDHQGIIGFEVEESAKFGDLKVGELVKATVKQVLNTNNHCSVIAMINDQFQAIIPQEQMSDYLLPIPPKFRIGSKLRARILSINEQRKNITLTLKPTLLTEVKTFSTLEEINHGDTLYGFVYKQLENGNLIKFYQDIVGFLSNQSLDGQNPEDIQVGQIIKVYVKYINAKEQKMFLSLKKVENIRKVPMAVEETAVKPVKSVKEPRKPALQVGQQVEGVVTSIRLNVVYVNLPDGRIGRIHKSQFECYENKSRLLKLQSEFENLSIGGLIKCTIVGEMKEEKKRIYECSCLTNYFELSREVGKDAGLEVTGIVKKIMVSQIGPVLVELFYNYHVLIDGWDIPIENGDLLNDLNQYIAIGSPCKVRLREENGKLKGEIVLAKQKASTEILYNKEVFRVISHHDSYVRVQLRFHNFASIDITELSEEWQLNLFDKYAIGVWGTCRIISMDKGFWGSVRETFLNDKLWLKCLHPVKSNMLAFQKQILSQPYDHRTSLYKNIPLEVGQHVMGYVSGAISFGSFVKVGSKTTVLIPGYVSNVKHQPIILMITKLDKLQGTADINQLRYKLHDQVLKVGDVIDGVVTNIKNEKAAVKILGTLQSGELDKKNAEGADDEDGWWANKLFKIGDQLKCIVIGTRQDRKGDNVLQLSNLAELIKTDGKRHIQLGAQLDDVVQIYESLAQLVADAIVVEEPQQQVEQALVEEPQPMDEEEEEQPEEEEEQLEEEIEQSEQVIDQARLDSRAEYEKNILSNPNSSILWIEFAAFVTESEGIENARAIMQKALRVINFANEVERLNLWTAYLNLEFNFGTEEHLIQVFKDGCKQCDSKQLHQKLITTYRKAQKYDVMIELARSFVQKFKQSSKSWVELLQSLLEWQSKHDDENPQYSIQDTLSRAMQALPKKKQIKVLAQFGRLQFQHNQVEEAKTTFESLLDKNSSRTDLWSQYIDLASKYCSPLVVRAIFNKATHFNKKPRKIKFLFKKQLEYETAYGDEQSVQKVKEQAQKWVQEYMQTQQGESD